MPRHINESRQDGGVLIIKLSGALADSGQLNLNGYATSLRGWHTFFELASNLYRRSLGGAEVDPEGLSLEVKILAERRGSYEAVIEFTLLAIASGIVGNRADALAKWSFVKLVAWVRKLFVTYRATKRRTADIEQVIEALESLARESQIILEIKNELV